MKLTGYKVKNQKALGLFAAGVVVLMFAIRYVLLSNGTIDELYTLEEEELLDALSSCEVTICAGDPEGDSSIYSGGGTILDARKNSTSDEDYTLTIAASLDIVGTVDDGRVITVTLSDGSEVEASLAAVQATDGFVLIQCLYPEELEAYYSLDILYRLSQEDPVYVLSGADLVGGSVRQTEAAEDGVEDALIEADLSGAISGDLSGAGLYGKSGNYLGLILRAEDTTVRAIPADIIMAALNNVL